ncbi:MAG TPA: LamG-like jellyroll fold domain-containing protein [Streptosporangiaceae bacterium]|nr:LamG-like jellyroll fold domain-containing protein [Streptosporangiaceae bacterium]
MPRKGIGLHLHALSPWNGRITAVVAGTALALSGTVVSGAVTSAQAVAASKPPAGHAGQTGHRIAHRRPLSDFAAGPKHLRGPSAAIPGKTRPARPVKLTPDQRAESASMKRAMRTGKPVLVGAETTATVAVMARPNGLLSMISNVFPVRVKVHGAWKPIDARLRRAAGNRWTPAASSMPVTFSGGGTGPLVTVKDTAGQAVSMYWPAAVPKPAIEGSVALYRNVLPGIDLRLKATGTGYQETLIVRDAAAAATPALRSLAFRVRAGKGLALRPRQSHSLGVVNARTGKLVFAIGQPQMWDSMPVRQVRQVTAVPVSYRLAGHARATIELAPAASALTGSNVRYPLYIDPEIAPATSFYAQVMATHDGKLTEEWDTSSGTTSQSGGITEIGDCGYSSCVWESGGVTHSGYTDRDYFRFATTNLEKRNGQTATVYQVHFDDEETYNSQNCTSESSAVYSTTGGISASTAWGGPQGSQLATASSKAGGGSSCPAANVDFSSTVSGNSALKTALQNVANAGSSTITLELRAASETTDTQYKRYKDNPTLTVYYNFAPLVPTALSVQNQVTCDAGTTYTSLTQPKLFATGTDNNPSPLQVKLTYTLQTSGGTAAGGTLPSPQGASGTQQSTTPPTALVSGTAYKFDVKATNVLVSGDKSSALTGPTSAFYPFTVLTGPVVAPTISSSDYPRGQWGQPAGAPGVFTVGTSGAPNIAGFAYSFDGGAGSEPKPTTTDCAYNSDGGLGTSVDSNGDGLGSTSGELGLKQGSTAQIEIPGTITPGQHTLFAVSFDKAHNISGESAYTFYVPQNFQAASQPVTFINGSTLVAGATGANASLAVVQTNCCSLSWRGGSQLIFNGTALSQTFTVAISVPDAGVWQLGADLTKASDYGKARIDLDHATSDVNLGGTATVPWDGYSPIVRNSYLDLGTPFLTAGNHTLTFTMTGQNASSTGFKAGINYLTLSPTSRQEGENLTASTPTAGTLSAQVETGTPWSGNGQLWLTNSVLGASFTVSFTAPVESDYALGIHLTTGHDYGSVRLDLDPQAGDLNLAGTAASPLDAYSPVTSATYVFLGGVHLTAGTHVLQVTVTGTDPASDGNHYNAGIDFLEAVPVTGASESSFTAAMNNLGIASDGATSFAGSFDLLGSPSGRNPSLQAMQSAGITPGTAAGAGATFTMGGANFTMPQLRTSGGTVVADNVIPDGQTIPLPQVKATDVALLVANSCGTTGGSPAMKATLNYGNGTASQPLMTPVPDWSLPRGSAAVAFSHWDGGTTPVTSTHPRFYEVMLPANPGLALSSITLPVPPVNFLTTTHSCTTSANILHILAIGTRPVAAGQGPAGAVWTGAYAGPMDSAISPAGGSLTNTTLREVIATTAAGSGRVRVELSNAHGMTPVTFDAATIGAQSSGTATLAAPVPLTFGGQASVTIPAGGDVYSDPAARPPAAGGTGKLVISLHIPATSAETLVPLHETPNSTTFYATGDQTANSDGTPFTNANSLLALYYVARIDVSDATPTDGTIAVLGDQTAAQAPAFTFGNWASDLPAALQADGVALPGSVADVASSGQAPAHWWRMNGAGLDTATTAYDSGSSPTSSLTLGGAATWAADTPPTDTTAGSLSLDGTAAFASSSGQAVDTAGSYAVSAWVKLSSVPSHTATVVAQDGTNNSGFYLGVRGGDWAFSFAASDTTGAAVTSATGPAVTAGTWTHLTGVSNSSTGTAQLYVNGTLAATAAVTGWASAGSLTVGRDKTGGVAGDFLPGKVSDVRVYSGPLFGTGVQQVYTDSSADTVTAAGAVNWFRSYVTAEPNLRDVIVSVGANDVLEGASATTIESDLSSIEQNLSTLIDAIKNYDVDNDPSLSTVQVILTTIVPLGLPASDPREAVRQAVDNWITGNNTTAQVISDVASAVAQPGSPNLIASSLLSGGVPTAAYYTDIADQIAADLSNAIPIFIDGL